MGDPAGIGPDITLKAWHARAHASLAPFVVYADAQVLADRAEALGVPCPMAIIADPSEAASHFPTALPVIDIPLAAPCFAGTPNSENAAAILTAITP